MGKTIRGLIFGVVALGCMAAVPIEASAMPVAGVASPAVESGTGQGSTVEQVYWRRVWRRPFGWRYGPGWRRPFGWRYGPGWRRPYRRFYRW